MIADAVRGKADAQGMREQRGHDEGNEDACAAGGDGGSALMVELRVVEFHADEEEKEDEADGGEEFELRQGGLREEVGGKMRGEASEDRRTDQDAADDLTDDARLPELPGEAAADDGDQQHDGHLEQQQGHGKNPFAEFS